MSLLTLGSNTGPTRGKTLVISHFDAHGVATGALLAKVLDGEVIARFPDTGPQRLAQFIRALDLYGKFVHIVDIPVNVANPSEHIAALEEAASNAAKLVMWDHHETDLKYVGQFKRVELRYFSSAADMAQAIAAMTDNPDDVKLLYVGVVADRDAKILEYVDRDTVEKELLPLANTLDILVRRDAQATANMLRNNGIRWLAAQEALVDYPPARLVNALRVVANGHRAVLLEPTTVDYARNIGLESWLPKTLEQLLLNIGRDYAVMPSEVEDRRTGQRFWSVRVLKYWLSRAPSPAKLLRDMPEIQGRQIVGHEDYVSIRAIDQNDAVELANAIFKQIEMPVSKAAHLISENYVAEAISSDYAKIIEMLERIAKALERGASAKEEQVRMLRDLYERDQRTRYD